MRSQSRRDSSGENDFMDHGVYDGWRSCNLSPNTDQADMKAYMAQNGYHKAKNALVDLLRAIPQ